MGEQIQKPAPQKKATEEAAPKPKDLKAKAEEIKKDMDDLIDEIDGVLEKNAEEFVQAYVQRGGQ